MSALFAAIILTPVLGAAAVWLPLFRRRPVVPALAAAVVVAAGVAWLALMPGQPAATWWQVVPGLDLAFAADGAALVFSLLAAGLWVPATAYAHSYIMRHPRKVQRFFTFYTLSLTATMGIALAGNMFTLYVFYELLTFVTWPLVIHNGTPAAWRAGVKYLIYSLAGAALVLAAMIVAWWAGGTLDFAAGGTLAPDTPVAAIRLLVLLLAAGFGVKAAVMPLHGWLPSAMAAPTPVSALLHAVAVVNAGCFGLLRTFYSLVGSSGLERAALSRQLLVLAFVTILLGSLLAMRQDQLKRRLAYSTVSQLGYITLGVFSGHPALLLGSLLHFVHHGLMKITLFFCAGAVITETGVDKVSGLEGMGRKMPLTMGAFALAALGMVGVVPINGFQSKWFLFQGALEAGRQEVIVVLLLSALLNALYFFPIIGAAFFRGSGRWQRERLASGLVWPPLLAALLCLIFGLVPSLFYSGIAGAVQGLIN